MHAMDPKSGLATLGMPKHAQTAHKALTDYNLNDRDPHGGAKTKALGPVFEAWKVFERMIASVPLAKPVEI